MRQLVSAPHRTCQFARAVLPASALSPGSQARLPSCLSLLFPTRPPPLLSDSLEIPPVQKQGPELWKVLEGHRELSPRRSGAPYAAAPPLLGSDSVTCPSVHARLVPKTSPLPASLWIQGNPEGHSWEVCRDRPEKATARAGAEGVWTSHRALCLVRAPVWRMVGQA